MILLVVLSLLKMRPFFHHPINLLLYCLQASMQRDQFKSTNACADVTLSPVNSSEKRTFESHDGTKRLHCKNAHLQGSNENQHLFDNSICVVTIHLIFAL